MEKNYSPMSCMGVLLRADLTGNGHPIRFCRKGLDDSVLLGNPWPARLKFLIFYHHMSKNWRDILPCHIPGLLHSVTDHHEIQNNHHLSKWHHLKHKPRSSSFFFVNLVLSKYCWERTLKQWIYRFHLFSYLFSATFEKLKQSDSRNVVNPNLMSWF